MEFKPQPQALRALWMWALDDEGRQEANADTLGPTLDAALSGDSIAFERIVVRYQRRILMLAWRMLGGIEDAKDVAQEVFLRAFKYLHRYDRSQPIEGWLVTIAINVCRDRTRQRQKQESFMAELPAAPSVSDPHTDLRIDERKRMLDLALQRLSDTERAAIILRDIEELSTAETAALMGRSEASVRALIGRGRVKIRRAIERMKGERP